MYNYIFILITGLIENICKLEPEVNIEVSNESHDFTQNSENVKVEKLTQSGEDLKHYNSEKPKGKKRVFRCVECNSVFRSRYTWSAHRMKHTDATPYICEICNARFPTNWALKIHKKKHLAVKDYQCKICQKTFK